VAGLLRHLGVSSNEFVALFLNRSFDTLAGQLGIMKAGAAYLPIGVDYPTDRVAYMLEDSGARVLLTQSAHLKELEGALGRVTRAQAPPPSRNRSGNGSSCRQASMLTARTWPCPPDRRTTSRT
jgi:non-ribosomal peptide synthetase component F